MAISRRFVDPITRGDPMGPLLWTAKSLRKLAAELQAWGHRIGHNVVAKLLRELGYSLQANRKTLEGASHPDRDAQFHYINDQVKAALVADQPAISVDTKKKELVGDFKNGGREYRPKGDPENAARQSERRDAELNFVGNLMPRTANARRKTAVKSAGEGEPRQMFKTRHRIVEPAGQVFAEKGYYATTGKEICERAAVNSAAINYHFGGMEALYQEVLRVAFEQLVALDLFEQVMANQPTPEDQLLALYQLMVQSFLDGSSHIWQWRVVSREAIAPSPETEEARLGLLVPKMLMFRDLVSALLHLPADHPAVAQGCLSIMAPVVLMQVGAWPAIERAFDGFSINEDNGASPSGLASKSSSACATKRSRASPVRSQTCQGAGCNPKAHAKRGLESS